MDDAKATAPGPKPKWWSRPQQAMGSSGAPGDEAAGGPPAAGQAAAAEPPAAGPVADRAPSGEPAAAAAPAAPVAPAPVAGEPASVRTEPEPPLPAADAPAGGQPPVGQPQPDRPTVSLPAATGGQAVPSKPLHDPDPYGTPPYGGPGPWAPAPPVQRPTAPPAGGPYGQDGPHGLPSDGSYGQPGSYEQPGAYGQHSPHGSGMTAAADGSYGPHGAHGHSAAGYGGAFVPPSGPPPPPPAQWQGYDPWGEPRPEPPEGKPWGRGRLTAAIIVVALVAGGIGGGIGSYLERNGNIVDVSLPQASAERTSRAPGSTASIASAVLPGVVTIHVRGASEQGTGTGFVLDKRGHILTNNHVVEPAGDDGEISVTFNGGRTAKATVVGRDSGYDLAVIKVAGASGLKPLALGNSDSAQVGDPVVAFGAPYELAGTVTSGIISAKERPITAGGEKSDGSDISYVDALQTDAPINPGNSGGPLVDAKARVIGINSAIRSVGDGSGLGGSQGGSIGLGFAIPVNQARRVAEELINTGRATHPVIGVTVDMAYSGEGARVNTKGVKGPAVTPDGPGDKAGLKPGDVITKLDAAPVRSGRELIVKIRSHRPGDVLDLTVEHDGQARTVRLTLGSASGS
ncbi:trypsin-like peptidase domain-containing protein [Streptomyces sp. NPDC050610]|uniref:S1C family serine protease n=1 Tax=Streptomyces sp. NPDC050610 TaxID=3157097 RepID=UPI003419A881